MLAGKVDCFCRGKVVEYLDKFDKDLVYNTCVLVFGDCFALNTVFFTLPYLFGYKSGFSSL